MESVKKIIGTIKVLQGYLLVLQWALIKRREVESNLIGICY